MGRAAVDWARRLACGERFDESSALEYVRLHETIDALYRAAR
jgi:hypothetical protein